MGEILDILSGIPINAVLRERLVDKETEISVLKEENAVLKAKMAVLEAENAKLKTKLQQIESDKTIHGDICPYCQQPKGKLLDIRPHSVFGIVGLKIQYYKCDECGKKYDKEQNP